MRLNFLPLLLWFWMLGGTLGAEPPPLFNGTNLNGFSTWLVDTRSDDPRRVFSVTNAMLRISGDGLGYLASVRSYSNFVLRLAFRWGARNYAWGDRLGKARDSGIFLHATGPDGNSDDGNGAFMAAVECNLFQGATGDFLLIRGRDKDGSPIAPQVTTRVRKERDADGWFTWDPGGPAQTVRRWGRINWRLKSPDWRDVTDFRGPKDVERAPGEWNDLEIQCQTGTVSVRLNGVLVNQAEQVFPAFGKILFQCEGSEIFFREIRLTETPEN